LNGGEAQNYPRVLSALEPLLNDGKTALTICFVIDPQYRNQGLARKLLTFAIEDFRSKGFLYAIGLPVESSEEPEKRYRGTDHMYQEAGYIEISRQGIATLVRKTL